MFSTRRLVPAVAVLALIAVGCGGSDAADDSSGTSVSTVDGSSPDGTTVTTTDGDVGSDFVDTVEPSATDAPIAVPPASEAPAPVGTVADGSPATTIAGETAPPTGAQAVSASLIEWGIEAPTVYASGEVTFVAVNNGNFPHEFMVIQGEGYESLPREEGGAVIEDQLPTGAILGRTGKLGSGSSEELTVDLAPGNYVLICNLGGGTNSHAGQGQRLDIAVS